MRIIRRILDCFFNLFVATGKDHERLDIRLDIQDQVQDAIEQDRGRLVIELVRQYPGLVTPLQATVARILELTGRIIDKQPAAKKRLDALGPMSGWTTVTEEAVRRLAAELDVS